MKCFIVVLLFTCPKFSYTQNIDEQVSKKELSNIVNKIADSLVFYYVNLEEGEKMGNFIKNNFKTGDDNDLKKPEKLAKQLTEDLRAVTGDLHLYVKYTNRIKEKLNEEQPKINPKYGESTNYGFQEIKFIEGNIAYIKISHFSNWNFANKARQKVTEIMELFKNSKAFIFDVRDNPGGVPYLVSYLSSYFFVDEPVLLTNVYSRFNNFKHSIYTEPLVAGYKYPKTPMYILVNNKSASGAEEFAFWLQNKNRATVIGQVTAGGGYGAMMHQLNKRFSISISSENYMDPDSKKGFQTIGVTPDIITDKNFEYTTALALAKNEIKKKTIKDSTQIKSYYKLLKNKSVNISEIDIFKQTVMLHQLGYLDYNDIEKLGKQYVEDPKKALPILKAQTILYSFYPQPFDNYAEVLATFEKYELAQLNYNKAVLLAEIKKNPSLNQIKKNREKFLEKYGNFLNDN
jgi:hypothetical protein